ncbi:MAG TPA: hypothetical protein VFR07_12660 [Mycobacteriales bacterium]|jgi:hypothetical protein|nr:hypothetical protein [Mycobacteriales bacterium]
MSDPSDVDANVLTGEPDSVHQLEGADDDLPVAADKQAEATEQDPRSGPEREADKREWRGLDRIVDANPTALGE